MKQKSFFFFLCPTLISNLSHLMLVSCVCMQPRPKVPCEELEVSNIPPPPQSLCAQVLVEAYVSLKCANIKKKQKFWLGYTNIHTWDYIYIISFSVLRPPQSPAVLLCMCVCVCARVRADGTFMTSHKTRTAAIAPGEVILLNMSTSHTQTHTVGVSFSGCS